MTETALFEPNRPLPTRPGEKSYLEYLAGLIYRADHQPEHEWTFWALAPVYRHWRAEEPGPVDYLWLRRGDDFALALVDVRTGQIVRHQAHPSPAPGSLTAAAQRHNACCPAPQEDPR